MAGSSSVATELNMVYCMIEKCLIFNMSKEECVEALSKHAKINPVITSTVWKELEKENSEFFKAYVEKRSKKEKMSEEELKQMIQKINSDSAKKSDD
ncbi:unnamed protein product [Eruca vesicaria subsp. sativa]|uniref:Angiotensin-converting enzyme 2 n=1 Tax=Eruca vesicaria subsp. sativa TaxID=29727 RepID=A0ABC8M1S8_ERUVS|nr:unnamed protein product [Eruca vesicaria subsp. sativa]